ncbi:MAG: zinc-binding dehydrogenase [Bryobacteraceae bacterium]
MSQSKAAVLARYNEPLEIRRYPVPASPGPGEAIIRVEMAGICGTDVHLWKGELPVPIPIVLGHESAGRIVALGEGLDKDWRGQAIRAGDRVTWASSVVCGECFYCRVKRQPTRCLGRKAYGISYCCDDTPHLRGGYAEVIVLRAGSSIFKLPETLETASLVGAGCALTTAIHGLERCPVAWGDTVVIQGTGPVGLAALAVARQSGAGRIVAVGGPPHRLELARRFGADVAVDVEESKGVERQQRIVAETGGYGADVVIECVGHPEAVNEGIELCRDGGKYLVLGQYANAGNISFNPHTITRKQLEVRGSWGFEPRHVDAAMRMLELGSWASLFAAQITHRFPLEEANEALETVRNWRAGKTVLIP